MNLKECYKKLGGDYDEVLTRLYSEDMIRRFLIKFLNDRTYKLLLEKLEAQDYQEVFRVAHTLKGVRDNLGLSNLCKSNSMLIETLRPGDPSEDLVVLRNQVCIDYEQAVAATQALGQCIGTLGKD